MAKSKSNKKLARKNRDTPPKSKKQDAMPRGVRITEISDTRKLLSRVINLILRGEIRTDKARALIYAASVLLNCFEIEKLELIEDRLDKIERGEANGEIPDYSETHKRN